MAITSVAIETGSSSVEKGSKHDLWVAGGNMVLTVTIDKQCKDFPPETRQCGHLNNTIQGLARAAKAVVFHAENDSKVETSFAMEPIEDIANAIILLSQLSDAIRSEVDGVQS